MGFHFFCPQGHILEAEIEQVGQAAVCPFCGTEMLIPAPLNQPTAASSQEDSRQASVNVPTESALLGHGQEDAIGGEVRGSPSFASVSGLSVEPGAFELSAGPEPAIGVSLGAEESQSVFHIPCPNGHILETPADMLGTPVMCPMCQTTFEPQYEASGEYRRKREEMAAAAAARAARFWLQLAIGAAIIVLGGLIMLIVFAPR